MAATYNPAALVTSNRDWVRFTVGDTVVSRAKLQDEEIDGLLTLERNKWLAAAAAAEAILATFQGVTSKQVGELSLSLGGSSEADYRAKIAWLREEGQRRLMPDPFAFRML